jgi:hypothetical protein
MIKKSIYMPEEMWKKCIYAGELEGITASDWIRYVLKKRLEKIKA